MARGAANWARRDEMGGIEGRGAYTGHQRGGRRAIGRDSSGGWRGKDEDKMTLNRQFLSQRHPTQIFFGWVPFPSPTASSWAPLQQTASGGCSCRGLSALFGLPQRPGTSRSRPPGAPQPQQKLDKTPPPTSSQPILTIAMTSGPLHLPCRPAAHPHRRPRDIRSTEPRARASLSVLTTSVTSTHTLHLNQNLVLLRGE